ncbi:MAG: redoxin domain-containing protein [Cytophagales bacterium]|nr:redoxin domain-containing protein [Armatimonadota bacterium]
MPLNFNNRVGILTGIAGALSLSAAAGLALAKTPQAATEAPKPVAPAPPASGPSEQAAKQLLTQMAAKYKGLTSYSADGALTVKNGANSVEFTNRVAYQNGKAAVEILSPEGTSSRIFDGTNLFVTQSSDPKTYRKQKAASPMAGIQSALAQADVGLLPLLLTDSEAAAKILPPGVEKVTLDPKEGTVDGMAVQVVTASMKGGQAVFQFHIGKTDGLIHRLTIQQLKNGVEAGSLTATYQNIRLNSAIDPAKFTFTPAAGQVAQAPPPAKEPAYFDARLKKGTLPLPFSGLDTSGKPLNLAQYKGKVVLIDFWATWCGPCRAELPNVTSVYGKYKPRGFDVVGVSLDEAADKPKLVSFVQANKMPWRQVFDGGGWQSKLAKTYGVRAIPFTLLIGKDGKIAAVNPRGSDLEPAVKAALAAR